MSGVRRRTCCGIWKALSIYLRSTCRRPERGHAILHAVNMQLLVMTVYRRAIR